MEPCLTDAKHPLDTLQCTTEIPNPKLISRKLNTDRYRKASQRFKYNKKWVKIKAKCILQWFHELLIS